MLENHSQPTKTVVRVAATSRTTAVAGAIAGIMRQQPSTIVQAVGAGAINQAVKAIAIAHRYLLLDGINIIFVPTFVDVEIGNEAKTAMCFVIEIAPSRTVS